MSSPSLPQLPVSLPQSCSRLLQPNSAKLHFLFFFLKVEKIYYFFNFLFYTRVWLINNVVIVSGGHQRDSATHIHVSILPQESFPGGASGKGPACKCRRCGFDLWVRKIPWRRAWQPTPVFLPQQCHLHRILAGYGP